MHVDEKRPTLRFECLTIHLADMPTIRQLLYRIAFLHNGQCFAEVIADHSKIFAIGLVRQLAAEIDQVIS